MIKNKNETILIRYDISGDFIPDKYYDILFDYDKCSSIIVLENTNGDDFLKEIDGEVVTMQYRGYSQIDKLKLFVLKTSLIRVDISLNKIFK